MPPIPSVVLDHVAVAVEQWSDAWPRYAVALGGVWSSGGLNVGFGPAQLRFANGGRIEILQPWQPEDNPFLRRFLDRHGPGPHHMTFKVPDLAAAIETARDAGFSPIGIDLSHDDWKEAFLHPHHATGVVVQLAQAGHGWESPAPEGFPTERRSAPASLLRVTHAVADLAAALALFEGLLGGERGARAVGPDGSWECVDLSWPGPPALRLVASTGQGDAGPGTVDEWLGGLPGRVHHLAFSTPDSDGPAAPTRSDGPKPPALATVPGVRPADQARQVVEPTDNLGTRLVLLDASGAP